MRRQCTEEEPLWSRPFAARYLGVSVEIIARLMDDGTLRYTYPFPGNERDARLFREDVIAHRAYMLGQATTLASLQQQNAGMRSTPNSIAEHARRIKQSLTTFP
ncbi:MAG: hypothetical protein J0I17_11365 ['Candidatus Kapabacteria' thiocyanatum]|nr:hypothetical protein ['Candidatus Kapabacteria' thiocyanatum]